MHPWLIFISFFLFLFFFYWTVVVLTRISFTKIANSRQYILLFAIVKGFNMCALHREAIHFLVCFSRAHSVVAVVAVVCLCTDIYKRISGRSGCELNCRTIFNDIPFGMLVCLFTTEGKYTHTHTRTANLSRYRIDRKTLCSSGFGKSIQPTNSNSNYGTRSKWWIYLSMGMLVVGFFAFICSSRCEYYRVNLYELEHMWILMNKWCMNTRI